LEDRGEREVLESVAAELYRRNGLQHLPFTTVFQLAVDDLVATADAWLLVPDLLTWWLNGSRWAEATNASTTGLVDVHRRTWDRDLLDRVGLGSLPLPDLVEPGTRLGGLRPEVAELVGIRPAVTTVGSHDTASAVVGVPMDAGSAAYVSCGTWGLVGVELERPVVTEQARLAGFTNEGGVDGRIRFLHNVMGLWVLSETIRTWERESGTDVDLGELLAAAEAVTATVPVFDVDDPRFLPPGDMPARIAEVCAEQGVPAPTTRAEFARSILESLAEAFARTVRSAAELSGVDVSVVHVVGGGSRNALLCQLTADRLGLPVLAGPEEATALGNVLVQARTLGALSGDLESLRARIGAAWTPRRFDPRPTREATR
ncbi:UNVERIFIED_CONTAM: carbohydrate kinase, partial [Mumia flava]